jgi:hypothetical protein
MPPLVRLLLMCALALKDVAPGDGGIAPWQIPFCMMSLFFIVHFPSLTIARDKARSFALAVHVVYHTILHSLILAAMEVVTMVYADVGDAYTWTTAAYLSLYYAWRIYVASHTTKRCTLSPTLLSVVMLSCVPLVVVGAPLRAPLSACTHLFAWIAADAASSLHPCANSFKIENV